MLRGKRDLRKALEAKKPAALVCREGDLHQRRISTPCPGVEDSTSHSFHWCWDLPFKPDFPFGLSEWASPAKIPWSPWGSMVFARSRAMGGNAAVLCNFLVIHIQKSSKQPGTSLSTFSSKDAQAQGV